MRRFLYDTAVFVYALGREHPYREPCRAILRLAERGVLAGEASVDLLQELAHQRFRQTPDRAGAVAAARDAGALCRLHELRATDVHRGMELFVARPELSARDAVFAALALNRGIDAILTSDRGFDHVPGLERVDPADEVAVAALAG